MTKIHKYAANLNNAKNKTVCETCPGTQITPKEKTVYSNKHTKGYFWNHFGDMCYFYIENTQNCFVMVTKQNV